MYIHCTAVFDYTTLEREVVFQPSTEAQQSLCVDVSVVNDAILENVETFHVEITTTAPRVTIPLSSATVSIEDDDRVEVTVVIGELGVEEDVEGGEVDVCVSRLGATEKAVEVELFTESDSAIGMCSIYSLHIQRTIYTYVFIRYVLHTYMSI